MRFKTIVLLHLLLLGIKFRVTQQQPSKGDIPDSPCPQLFKYKYNGNDWYGELELPSPPIQHREVILKVVLSLRAATNVR